jgi:PAS domain S-box-containing protein
MTAPRILIVEDEVIVARDLEQQLRALGYDPVGLATRGEDVLALVGALAPDLVLMDIQLAGAMDGVAAALEIRKHHALPVVFLTAFAADDTLIRAKLVEPFGYIIKPFSERELRTVLVMALYKAETEARLRESDRLLRETQAIAGLGSYVLDLRTGMWTSSSILDDIFGIDDAYVRSVAGWQAIVHPDWRERMTHHFVEEVLGHHRRFDMSYRIIRQRDGVPRWVHGLGKLEFDNAAQPVRLTGTITDITARKELEEQFFHAQRLESIGTLASGIAHDLNNVLAPIMMSVDLALSTTTDERTRSLLEIAAASARRGADIVAQVLSFSRGDSGRRVEVEIHDLIGEIERVARETFPKNIDMRVGVRADAWTVLADPTQLHQVLLNLCINARDAMPEGGAISITTANVTLDADEAARHVDGVAGRYLVVQVADTGVGIPNEIIDRMFDPFFTTKGTSKGTGLGLSTVRTIVKHHGGFLRVSSQQGVGTSFWIYLPAEVREARVDALVGAAAHARGGGEWILVVDDEASVRGVTRHILETAGYSVIEAADGVEAVAAYAERSTEIAAVIMDMMMPLMDGAAAIRALATIDPSVRVLAVSGVTASQEALPALDLGAYAFQPKPYSAKQLLEALRKVLAQP